MTPHKPPSVHPADAPPQAHESWSLRLAASLDDELDAEARRELDQHLLECPRCQGELKAQRAMRSRLRQEPLNIASQLLRERVQAIGAQAAIAAGPRQRPRVRRWVVSVFAGGGWALAAALALVLLGSPSIGWRRPDIPMVVDALADYRWHTGQLMLAPGLPPAQLMQATLGWSTPPLPLRNASLISSWPTRVGGEAAVALAYRSGNHIVVQYIVSEAVFFRQPRVRDAVALHGEFLADTGDERLIAKPSSHAGHLLVGTPQALREAMPPSL